MKERLLGLLLVLLGLVVGLLALGALPRAHELPEYTARTGESCGTCHVNPAGGGARTARSALWIAQGRPDKVPELPAADEPGVTEAKNDKPQAPSAEGEELYAKLGCGGCHGTSGEGGVAPALNVPEADDDAEQVIRDGADGMMAYGPDILSDGELASMLEYLQALAGGNEADGPDASPKPLPSQAGSPAPICGAGQASEPVDRNCGGN